MSKQIEITIKPDGTATVEAMNFKGVGCKDATKQIELALAGPNGSVDSKPKDDFYQSFGNSQDLCR
jgi:hypothetical protein